MGRGRPDARVRTTQPPEDGATRPPARGVGLLRVRLGRDLRVVGRLPCAGDAGRPRKVSELRAAVGLDPRPVLLTPPSDGSVAPPVPSVQSRPERGPRLTKPMTIT